MAYSATCLRMHWVNGCTNLVQGKDLHVSCSNVTQVPKEKKIKRCRNPGSNQGPLDLQSNALPTELFRLLSNISEVAIHIPTVVRAQLHT